MALSANELFSSNAVNALFRVDAITIQPKEFAQGSGTLALLTPVAFNTSTNKWVVWGEVTKEVSTITAHGTPASGGTWTLTIDGETTAALAFDITAAAIQTALDGLSNIDPGDVACVATSGTDLGDASAVVTITWAGKYAGRAPIVSAVISLTGNDHVLAEATAGVEANDTNVIRGFVWPDAIVLASANEVMGNVLYEGKLHYADVVLPSGEAEAVLKTAIRDGLRERGLIVQGLSQVR